MSYIISTYWQSIALGIIAGVSLAILVVKFDKD